MLKLKIMIMCIVLSVYANTAIAQTVNFSNSIVIKDTSVIIHWNSVGAGVLIDIEPAIGQIEYGPSTSYGSQTPIDDLSYSHTMELTGLTPGQTYHYRVKAKGYYGGDAVF